MKRLIVLLTLTATVLCACSAQETPPSVTNETNLEIQSVQTDFQGADNVCLFENESCSLTLTKAEIDTLSDYCWDVTLVNFTDTAQIFTFRRVYVNDFDFDPLWAERVEAGQTLHSEVIWSSPEMQARGMTQVTRVDFSLCVYEADMENTVANESLTVYPSSKSAHIPYVRSGATTDIDILNNDYFYFTLVDFDAQTRWGKELQIYAENRYDFCVVLMLENVTVNDQPCDPHWKYTLDGGKQGFSRIVWFDSALEAVSADSSLKFEYDLLICDENGTVLERVSHTFVP